MNRKYLALTLALTAASAHGTTIVSPEGTVSVINKTSAGYSSTTDINGVPNTTQYLTSPNGITVIPQDGAPQTFSVLPDADGAPVLLIDQAGEE